MDTRLAIAQALWGEGSVGPGTPEFLTEMFSMLGLTKEHSIAWLGIGLGGPARELSRQTGVWITGYERRPELVALGQEQALMSGLAKRVSVQEGDPADLELPVKKFHTVISRDDFCFTPDKARVLEQCYESLRVGGTFLFTDYVANDPEAAQPEAESWFGTAWGEASLWHGDTYTDALTQIGFDLRGKVDISHLYTEFITRSAAAWSRLTAEVAAGDFPGADIDRVQILHVMSEEAEQWSARLKALEAGKLKVLRFTALRPDGSL
jgi:SAM-dependent methyltransferase